MAKKNRVHVNYRLRPEVRGIIRKYAKKHDISEGQAVDEIVFSCEIKDELLRDMDQQLRKLTLNSHAF